MSTPPTSQNREPCKHTTAAAGVNEQCAVCQDRLLPSADGSEAQGYQPTPGDEVTVRGTVVATSTPARWASVKFPGGCAAIEWDALVPANDEPSWWPPQSGDVAFYEGCVEGGDPYRVTVSYRYDLNSWMNVSTGLVQTTPIWPGRLTLLVRDGLPWGRSS